MKRGLELICAGLTGASLMYLFDPKRGKRRRALLGNKAVHLKNVAADVAGKAQRDVYNHVRGAVAELVSRVTEKDPVSNDVLEARVRSKLGHVISHPSAVQVKAVDGQIILSGRIPTTEVHPLLNAVINVRGVNNIENYLAAYEQAGELSALH